MSSVCYSPDGLLVATASGDSLDGAVLRTLNSQRSSKGGTAEQHEGAGAGAGAGLLPEEDFAVRVWEPVKGQGWRAKLALTGHTAQVRD